MLEISCRNGSYNDPLVGPRLTSRECQTDDSFLERGASNNSGHSSYSNSQASIGSKVLDPAAAHGAIESDAAVLKPEATCQHCRRTSASNSSQQPTPGRANQPSHSNSSSIRPNENSTPSSSSSSSGSIAERPLSVASVSSDSSESSTSEDDEVAFNTIKRQTHSSSNSCKPEAVSKPLISPANGSNGNSEADPPSGENGDSGDKYEADEKVIVKKDAELNGDCEDSETRSSTNGEKENFDDVILSDSKLSK